MSECRCAKCASDGARGKGAPRNVRNWWLELEVDGRKSEIATGPQKADGGFDLLIQQRRNGEPKLAGRLRGRVQPDGTLLLLWDGVGEPATRVLSQSQR